MEKPVLPNSGSQSVEAASEKPIKIAARFHEILKKGLSEINADPAYSRSVSLKRYVEKLIEDNWRDAIPSLIKEREASKDWLQIEFQKRAPGIPFFDWIKLEMQDKALTKRPRGRAPKNAKGGPVDELED